MTRRSSILPLAACCLALAAPAGAEPHTVVGQAAVLAAAMQDELAKAKLTWTEGQIGQYTTAYRQALAANLAEPLDEKALAALKEGQADWVRHNLASAVGKDKLEPVIGGLRYAVEAYAKREPTGEDDQKRIDARIEAWVRTIEATVRRVYPPGDEETLAAEVKAMREALLRDSRNVLFPGLKAPLDDDQQRALLVGLAQGIAQQAQDLAGKPPKPGVDWRRTSVWTGATRAVNKTLTPPRGQALFVKAASGSTGIRLEVGPSPFGVPPKPAR